jgi:O-methyltransferase
MVSSGELNFSRRTVRSSALPLWKEESTKDDTQRHQLAVKDEISSVTATGPADLYFDLLARTLTRALFEDSDRIVGIPTKENSKTWVRLLDRLAPALGKAQIEVSIKQPYSPSKRESGRDWPARAETMCGLKRLANARDCIEHVLSDKIPGDIIETGVWRGGMSIFMRGVLKAFGVTDRTVWLADSFEGLPVPDLHRYPTDRDLDLSDWKILSVGVEQVRHNFERYGLLDDQVRFIVGWFRDTLKDAPIKDLAVMRLDGDLYESTIQALEPLYPKLAAGGYCIIDDYGVIDSCKEAVNDYRRAHGISDEIVDIDGAGFFWRKSDS